MSKAKRKKRDLAKIKKRQEAAMQRSEDQRASMPPCPDCGTRGDHLCPPSKIRVNTNSVAAIACPFCGELMKDFDTTPGYRVGTEDLPKIQEAFRYAHGCMWAMDDLLGRNTREREIERIVASPESLAKFLTELDKRYNDQLSRATK